MNEGLERRVLNIGKGYGEEVWDADYEEFTETWK